MSKFSLEVLSKYVHPFIQTTDPEVILGSVFGEDVALTRIEDGMLVSHVDPIVGAVKDIGWLAVHVACNDVATSGTPPRWILLLVLVPHKEDEHLLEDIMRDAGRAANEIGVSIIGGHTGYSSNLSRPLVAVTALGTLAKQNPVLTKGAHVGDHLFITKGIALEGTAILANDFANTASQLGISEHELTMARELMKSVSIIPEALIFAQQGATAMHDVTRGGLLETLLEVAKLSEVGIEVDASRIPISPVVSRFSKAFQFDPLKMISSGTLVAAIPLEHVEATRKSLDDKGIVYADIGEVIEGKGVQIIQEEQATLYQEIHCEEDELARMWEIYSQDAV
ncbi:MAG: hydrogenase expression/formation protein HypE [Anaerolineaceae bacterium]|nr:hydrogenase expression/formation protein HypE [Anaerolineaceae bacterium]